MHSTKDMFDYLTVKELLGLAIMSEKVPRIGRMKTYGTLSMIRTLLEKHQPGAYDILPLPMECPNE